MWPCELTLTLWKTGVTRRRPVCNLCGLIGGLPNNNSSAVTCLWPGDLVTPQRCRHRRDTGLATTAAALDTNRPPGMDIWPTRVVPTSPPLTWPSRCQVRHWDGQYVTGMIQLHWETCCAYVTGMANTGFWVASVSLHTCIRQYVSLGGRIHHWKRYVPLGLIVGMVWALVWIRCVTGSDTCHWDWLSGWSGYWFGLDASLGESCVSWVTGSVTVSFWWRNVSDVSFWWRNVSDVSLSSSCPPPPPPHRRFIYIVPLERAIP